jgi:hypothetical protein
MRLNLSYRQLRGLIEQANPAPRTGRQTHADVDVALAYLWAEMHEQPTYWASSRKAYPIGCRFVPPSAATLSRRLGRVPVRSLIARVRGVLLESPDAPPVRALKIIDSKPLTVGNSSSDRAARRGRAAGSGRGATARGYKICTVVSGDLVRPWVLGGLNDNDQTLAAELIPQLSKLDSRGWGYVTADNGFDGNRLYVAAAGQGHVWVAPPRRSNRGVRDAQRNSSERLRSLDLSDTPLRHAGPAAEHATMGSRLRRDRATIEPMLGHATMLGLRSPPPWVRTPKRVALHVEAKLIFHTYRVLELHRQRRLKAQSPAPPLPPKQSLPMLPVPKADAG